MILYLHSALTCLLCCNSLTQKPIGPTQAYEHTPFREKGLATVQWRLVNAVCILCCKRGFGLFYRFAKKNISGGHELTRNKVIAMYSDPGKLNGRRRHDTTRCSVVAMATGHNFKFCLASNMSELVKKLLL